MFPFEVLDDGPTSGARMRTDVLRIAYVDLYKPEGWNVKGQERGVRATLGISILLWLPAAGIMLRELLIHNFGLFGG